MSGSCASKRSVGSAEESEDRAGTVFDRTRVAGGVHRQPAAWAQRAAGGQHALGLYGEFGRLLVAEPEAHARSLLARARVARRAFAGDQDEHAPVLVVAQSHFTDLPLGLAGQERAAARSRVHAFDALVGHHLLQADEEGLDLRLLARQRERAAGPAGEQEELARPRLADRRHGDVVDRVELEDGHLPKTTGMWFRLRIGGEENRELTIEMRARHGAWRNRRCRKP